MNLNEIYTEIITDANSSKRNKRHLDRPTVVLKGVNPSCGDEISLELRLNGDIIEDASFTGVGCAISQASASIMIDLIKGKTVEQARGYLHTFMGMIHHEITDEKELDTLDEAVAFRDISHLPSRVKCAVLGWHTLEQALNDAEKKKADGRPKQQDEKEQTKT